jgi:uncharacterized membrane protein
MSLLRTCGLWWLVSCDGPTPTATGDTGAPLDCTGLDWDSVGAPFVFTYCTGCHATTSANRGGAPAGVDFDTYAGVIEWLERVEVRAVELRNMPPTGGPPEYELEQFGDWIRCGAPE